MKSSDNYMKSGIVCFGLIITTAFFWAPAVARDLFAPAAHLDTGRRPTFAVIGEVTGDQFADLLVVSAGSDELHVYAGNDAGKLAEGRTFAAGPKPSSLALGDFDEDGDADIAIANHETSQVTLLLNDGSGVFAASSHSPLRVRVRPHAHAVAAADMNADGHLDVVIDDRGGKGFVFLRGRGDGSFEPRQRAVLAGGDPYFGMTVADLDGNGYPDIVAPVATGVTVTMNESSGFRAPQELAGRGAFAVAAGDFNGDGLLDVATASEDGNFDVRRQGKDGEFEQLGQYATPSGAKRLGSGDFDADGFTDFVLQNFMSNELLLFMGGETTTPGLALAAGAEPWGIATGDLNNDGHDDLVSLDHKNDVAFVFLALP